MIINVASKNPIKIDAVKEIIKEYEFLAGAEIKSVEVPSRVSEQPISLEETVKGAIIRAKNSFNGCQYSFGIESGLEEVPSTKTGYMEVCICSIYDGRNHHIGKSCSFELPINVTKIILEDNLDINDAAYKCGLTNGERIGSSIGIIGMLTKGKVTRKDYTKQAIQMAIIQLENPQLY